MLQNIGQHTEDCFHYATLPTTILTDHESKEANPAIDRMGEWTRMYVLYQNCEHKKITYFMGLDGNENM